MKGTKAIFKRIGILLACAAILSYSVYHLVSLFKSEISTVVVGETVEETVIEFDGYIFRDETLITSSYSGAVDYIASDGLKVSVSETLAHVYEKGNSRDISKRLNEIDRDIEVIEAALSRKQTLDGLPALNESVGDMHSELMKKLAQGNMRGLRGNIDELTAEMDRILLATGKKETLDQTLERLKKDREELVDAGGEKEEIKSQKSGYFYSGVDGYESIFTISAAESLTFESFAELVSAEPQESLAVGKMAFDSEWRFVAQLNAEDAAYFEEGVQYEFVFTGNKDARFPMTLVTKLVDGDSQRALLTFFCDRAPTSFSFDRMQSVEAVVDSVRGISVPRSAIHKRGGVLYVYILNGSVVLERRINVVYEGNDHYIVSDGYSIESDGGIPYLGVNDVLIIDGNNLFDGRIID